jgi:4-hydroxyphenylpyruvate dioxygenase
MDGGFFFEIVERRNYQGYGALNAPIRLASQTQLSSVAAPPEL